MSYTVLDGYHRPGFHKVWYPPETVLTKISNFFTPGKGINIFIKKIKLVLTMLILTIHFPTSSYKLGITFILKLEINLLILKWKHYKQC
jgi:hypothetical protein